MKEQLFLSVLEQDTAPIVLCDLQHTIVYMNPAACHTYAKYGGGALVGKDLLACHNAESAAKLRKVLAWFEADAGNNCVHTFYDKKNNLDVYVIALRSVCGELIGYYEKQADRNVDTTPLYDMV